MPNFDYLWESSLAVDSGHLAIADPCFFADTRLSYQNFIDAHSEQPEEPIVNLGYLDRVDSNMGIGFPTPHGDGIYDVYSVWHEGKIQGVFVSFVDELGEHGQD